MQRPMWYTVRRATANAENLDMTLQILFLLSGTMTVRCQDQDTTMHTEDVLVVDANCPWQITHADDAVYGAAHYEVSLLTTVLGSSMPMFFCNSAADMTHSYHDLRDQFFRLTAEYTAKTHSTDLLMDCLLLGILDTLVEHYHVNMHDAGLADTGSDYRMHQIMQYVTANLNQDINLTELAEQMYVSTSTLSRIFKKNTGVYFADFVMQLRVKASLSPLAYTDQSVTQIALSNGFSNSATFTRAFRKFMDTTPTEYREKYRAEAADQQRLQMEQEAQLRHELKEMGYGTVHHEESDELVLDLHSVHGVPLRKVWSHEINIGALCELIRANVQYHVLRLHEQLHFEHVRTWNLFSTHLLLTDGKEDAEYNFDLLDQALDFLVEAKLKPTLDFGRRPRVASKTDDEAVFYEDDYIPFESRRAWEQVVNAVLQHVVYRYGPEEVSTWIYELTYDYLHQWENAHFWPGEFRYEDAYAYMYDALRARIPLARFGTGGADITIEWQRLNDLIAECKARNMIPDNISFTMLPYELHREDKGRFHRRKTYDPAFEEKSVAQMRQLFADNGLDRLGVKLSITEMNCTISSRNYVNDSVYRAAYLVYHISKIWDKVDNIAVMTGSDWINNYMDAPHLLTGALGILSKDTIRKPAFYALDFLNRLGNELLAQGEHYLATRKESGSLYILCFNYTGFRSGPYHQKEDLDLHSMQKLRYENEKPLRLPIRIENPGPLGTYCLKRHVLNDEHGSILDAWNRFGFDPQLTRDDVKYLDSLSVPMIEQSKVKITRPSDCIELEIVMRPEELTLLHIYRLD